MKSPLAITCLLPISGILVAISAINAATPPYPREYELLNRKSIFARDRRSSVPTSASPGFTLPTSRPVPLPTLIGIIEQDTGPVAMFEQPDTGKLTAAYLGSTIPGYTSAVIIGINLDYIEFVPAPDQPARRIMVGQDTKGAAAVVTPSTDSSATSQPAIPEGDDPISRMRRRRMQETGR